MTLSVEELVIAREAANAFLEELDLDAYIFEIEPKNTHYELRVECACETDGGWASVSLTLPKAMMLGGLEDANITRQLLDYWNKKLLACKRNNH